MVTFVQVHPKFIIQCSPDKPLTGTFVFGLVCQHKDLVQGYGKVHGGGWYHKDDERKLMELYGRSGDYGAPDFRFLDRIPASLKGYTFTYSPDWGPDSRELLLEGVEWF